MSATTKHTPGPWKLEDGPLGRYIYADSYVGPVACMYSRLDLPGHCPEVAEQRNANAQIVVTAPDLLDVLRLAFEYLDNIPETAAGGDDEAVRIARAAKKVIAQAEGRTA